MYECICSDIIFQTIVKKSNFDPAPPENFRTTSELPSLSRILEKCDADWIFFKDTVHNIFDIFKFVYFKIHSTEMY